MSANLIEVDLEEMSEDLAILFAKVMMGKQIWKFFGFRKRPKRGLLNQYFFQATSNRFIEFLPREVISICLADLINAVYRIDTLNQTYVDYRKALVLGVVNYFNNTQVFTTKELLTCLSNCSAYINSNKDEAFRNFMTNLEDEVKPTAKQKKNYEMRALVMFTFIGEKSEGGWMLNVNSVKSKTEKLNISGENTLYMTQEEANDFVSELNRIFDGKDSI